MKPRTGDRRSVGVFSIVVLMGTVVSAVQLQQLNRPAVPCAGTLDGSTFPYMVPEYVVWHRLFQTVQSLDDQSALEIVGGNSAAAASLLRVSRALARQSPANTRPGSNALLMPSSAAAPAILAARDELIRGVAKEAYEHLRGKFRQIRQGRYTFESPGVRVATSPARRYTCRIAMNGKDDPYLIPEGFVWAYYFHMRADAVKHSLTRGGRVKASYVALLHSKYILIPVPEIHLLLQVASEIDGRIESLRQNTAGRGALDIELAIEDLVLSARDDLTRRLPSTSWAAVLTDVEHTRRSSRYDFPCLE
jgi:hypothetical protein